MPTEVRIELDSVNPSGQRLTTFVLKYPRIIHAELLTHRLFSRNSSSSRAIPVMKMISLVEEDPFIPVRWGKATKGMQATETLSEEEKVVALAHWKYALEASLAAARGMAHTGVAKELANRVLEPWSYITVILSGTEFKNFYRLRRHADAQPEMQQLANLMYEAQEKNKPKELGIGEWHMPFVSDEERSSIDPIVLRRISVARCARVSYLTHDGKRDPKRDDELYYKLLGGSGGVGHMSPFEHVAMATGAEGSRSNFRGWFQYRKLIPNESGSKG